MNILARISKKIKQSAIFIAIAIVICNISPVAVAINKPLTIAIIVPVEIPAMQQIVQGLKQSLRNKYKNNIKILVKNAQGDINLERSIIQQLKNTQVDIVAPIGTNATELSISLIKNKNIIGIAVDKELLKQAKYKGFNVTGVSDEIIPKKQIIFIKQILPNWRKLSLIYSTESHVYHDQMIFNQEAKRNKFKIQNLMIRRLSDIYTIKNNIDTNSDAILILKDAMIVSAMPSLVQIANKNKLPIMASDDGSVAKGASFALGVREYDIGKYAANLIIKIITNHKQAKQIPIKIMTDYKLFVNKKLQDSNKILWKKLQSATKKLNYKIIYI